MGNCGGCREAASRAERPRWYTLGRETEPGDPASYDEQ
jgi:hypothetical protein